MKPSASIYLKTACNSAILEFVYLAAVHTGLSNVMDHSNFQMCPLPPNVL